MEYHTYPPDSELDALIKCFWTLRIPKEVPKGQQQILPDGCMDLIFNLGDEVKRIVSEEEFLIQPRAFVLGQIKNPCWIEPTGKVETFAVRFHPGSFAYFTSVPMSGLVDKDTELSELFDRGRVRDLEAAIIATEDTHKRIEILSAFLVESLAATVDVDQLLSATLEKIFQTRGSQGLTQLLEGNQNQRRKIERKFSKLVGLSPKQLCRIIRLQASLRHMLEGDKSLTHVGNEGDFFDQAHFVKDFKDFTGVSPKEFYKDPSFALSSVFYGSG